MTDLFYELDGNPVPENAFTGFLTTRDRKQIRFARFSATARPLKGTVVVLPGRNECIEKYFETVRNLTGRGFGVAMLDWRGQGASDRLLKNPQRGYVKSFQDYARDLEQLFTDVVLPDCRGPYYILAHSAGALVALLASANMVNRVQRMVLIAPFLDLPDQRVSMATVRRLGGVLTCLGLGRLYAAWGPRKALPTPFERNLLTSDPERYRRNTGLYQAYPQLALGGPTVRWLRAAAVATETVRDPEFMAAMKIPTLIIGAGNDRVVSTRAVEHFARHIRLGSFVMIDGAKHEILQEKDYYREQFLAAFDAFIPGSEAQAEAALG